MVMTILEARVAPEKWASLEQTYKAGTDKLDPGILQTFLIHSSTDPGLWRLITLWRSREALDEMRRSPETPRGVLFFREAGADPTLSVFDVAARVVATETET
jgi:quinol monooxygenase YgiN